MLGKSLVAAGVIIAMTAPLSCQAPEASALAHHEKLTLNKAPRRDDCSFDVESFPLKKQDLTVINAGGGVLFSAGMTIDADGAPNAYAPHNRGLDYTANAKGADGWVALVTDEKGRPVVQKSGRYRGYYVSTTSLEQRRVSDERNPKRYVDATKVPYIALPEDFARTFDIRLGDLALIVNQANGRSAYAVYADVGPKGRIGEGSIALAKALGMPANPRHDGVAGGVIYLVFPGSALRAKDPVTARNIKSSAARLYHRWGGTQKLRTCEAPLLSADQ
jgi:Fungal chitosanase of glycosyl hydrolase group 75